MNGNRPENEAEVFYARVLKLLNFSKIPFMIGGTYAVRKYTGIMRGTKDMDLFCKPGDSLKILELATRNSLNTEITDDRWLAKIIFNNHYTDLIFGTTEGIWNVDDSWFEGAPKVNLFGTKVKLIPAEELIWSKAYIQDRDRFDGADINHLFLKMGGNLDWKRLLRRMEAHWEMLFSFIVVFRFIYPSERVLVPKWLMEELISRVKSQMNTATPKQKVCRGPLLSKNQYQIDVKEWGFQDFYYTADE